MKFLQIRDGVFVLKSAVECVEIIPEGGTRIFTMSTSYDSPYNHRSILELLEVEDIEQRVGNDLQIRGSNGANPNVFGMGQHWAG